MVAVDGVVFFQVLDPAKAAYEVSDLYTRDHGALDHQPAHRHGLDGPRRDPVEARRDQHPAARRGRQCDRELGREDHSGRTARHPAATGHRQRDDPADEGRAREARRRSSKRKARASPRSCAPRAKSRARSCPPRALGKRRSAKPRRANAPPRPKPRRPRRSATRSSRGSAQAINYFIAQKYVEAIAEFARSPNAKTILFPVEATQLIGTLGGIGELAKEAIGGSLRRVARRAEPKPCRAFRIATHERTSIPDWLWLIGGVVLLIAEVIAPGFFLMFIGAAAIATGLLALAASDRRRRCSSRCSRSSRSWPSGSAGGGLMRRATTTRATLCSTTASDGCSAGWSSWSSQSMPMAAGCALATANGPRAAAPPQSAIACGSSMSTAIA